MTTINFPSSPVVDQVYTFGSRSWKWNGLGWLATSTDQQAGVLTPNLQTGTAYTLVIADAGKRVAMSNAASNVVTVPPNSAVPFQVNAMLFVSQDGAGSTSIAAGVGVTVNSADGLKIGGQYKMASLIKTATDTWMAIGTTA